MWPGGPRYEEWVGAGGWRGWVLFKLMSADWYVDRLEEVGGALGFDRYIGVEMAMDAALGSINGAFDATVAAVIEASQLFEEQAARDTGEQAPKSIPQHLFSWKDARRKLEATARLNINVEPLLEAVDAALLAESVDAESHEVIPMGWLQQLRRLRNRTVHQGTLARSIDVVIGEPNPQLTSWGITVGGRGEDPVDYIRTARRAVELLLNPMLEVCDLLAPLGIPMAQAVFMDPPTARTVAPDDELQQLIERLTGRA